MLDLYYTEKLLGLQGVEVKKIQENQCFNKAGLQFLRFFREL